MVWDRPYRVKEQPVFTHDDVFIDGRWQPSAAVARLPVVNPATEETWARVPDGGVADRRRPA